MAVAAQRQRRTAGQPAWQVDQAVTQVGLGAGADHHAGAGAAHRVDLCWRGMGGVHQVPAAVELHVLRQPVDRPPAGGGQAIVDLGGLLGDVDVDRAVVAGQRLGQLRDRRRPRGAQRMDGHAGRHQRLARSQHALAQRQHVGCRGGKAALVVAQRRLLEAGALVQHRQQRQADAGVGRGLHQCLAHRQPVGIGLAIGLLVQVVEFTHLGVAALQQLGIQLAGHGAQRVGRYPQCHGVHAVAPAPEIIVCAAAALGQAGKGALEGMAVGIDQTRQHRARQHRGPGRGGHAGLHLMETALRVDVQQHLRLPAAAHPGLRRPQQLRHAHAAVPSAKPSMACTSCCSSGCTAAARPSCQAKGGTSSM
jgi:hypothetical protein